MAVYTKADKSSKFCQRRAHVWQKLIYFYAFVYSSLMKKTLCRSKRIGGTKVTNDYLLLICNLLDQIPYISFLIFRSYFLTTYSGRIRFADAISLFHSHEVICDLCGWSGNRWRAGGGRDPVRSPPGPFSLHLRGLGNWKHFLPWHFLRALAELSWEVVMWAGGHEWEGGSLSGHILGGSAGALPVYCLL
jgi:hypothetical protein